MYTQNTEYSSTSKKHSDLLEKIKNAEDNRKKFDNEFAIFKQNADEFINKNNNLFKNR